MISCLILGSGPAGYTAAIYAGRSGLQPVIYEGLQPGGQLTITTEIENYPGFPEGIDANEMMDDMRKQALRFGTEIRPASAVKVDLSQAPYKVWFDDDTMEECQTLIIATGASAKYLGLADEKKYQGMGVSACATCDGFFYRKKVVAVVGGGDTACEEATYLAGLAQKVYLIVRKPFLRASKAMQDRVMENPKIEVLFRNQHPRPLWRRRCGRCPPRSPLGRSRRASLRFAHRWFLPRHWSQAQQRPLHSLG